MGREPASGEGCEGLMNTIGDDNFDGPVESGADWAEETGPSALSRGELLRAAADGEPWAVELLGEAGDDDARRVAFERGMREAVARSMSGEAAPDGLRERVAAAMAAASADEGSISADVTEEREAGVRTGEPVLARIGGWFALAAVLLLSAVVVIQGVRSATPPVDGAYVSRVAEFVSAEHDACEAFGARFERKFVSAADGEGARPMIEGSLGECPDWICERIDAVVAGGRYEFMGVGPCKVPGPGASVHLMFRGVDDGSAVSVFVQKVPSDDGEATALLPTSAAYLCGKTREAGEPVAFWRNGSILVFTHAADAEAEREVRRAFGAPAPTRTL